MIGQRRTSRRFFLGGAAAVVALPFLESALPRVARAQATSPQRFLGYFVPNGIRMAHWTPDRGGADYDLKPITMPLAPVQNKVSLISGLANRPAQPDDFGDHASGTASFLTVTHAFKTEGADIRNGISLDQQLARTLGDKTALRSLELGIDGGSSAGGCDSGYSCAYARNISWTSPTTPLPKLVDPQAVFDRLFAGIDPNLSAAEAARRKARGKSVLDYVLADARSLASKLGKTDRNKLEEYSHGVRELELRIAGGGIGQCSPGERPQGGLPYPQHVRMMSDLMVLAFQCDITRFCTFMLGNAVSNRTYDFLGVPGQHHEISHHQGDSFRQDQLTKIGTWEMEQFSYLLQQLDAVDEGGGKTLLDSACVFLSSDIEDGNTHSHFNMPIALAGSAGGKLRPGRHLSYDDQPSVGSLFVSILQAFGLPDTRFGDADGPLDGLA
jgi:hypothetical protein